MSFLLAFIWFKVQGSGLRWLINTKAHLQRCAFCLLSFGLGFKVQGSGLRWRLRRLFYWAMPESSILVTSRFYDTREGIVSYAWYEILRLSPHLFWLGLFTHRAFSSAQDDDTRGRKGSHRIGRMDGEFIFPIAAFL